MSSFDDDDDWDYDHNRRLRTWILVMIGLAVAITILLCICACCVRNRRRRRQNQTIIVQQKPVKRQQQVRPMPPPQVPRSHPPGPILASPQSMPPFQPMPPPPQPMLMPPRPMPPFQPMPPPQPMLPYPQQDSPQVPMMSRGKDAEMGWKAEALVPRPQPSILLQPKSPVEEEIRAPPSKAQTQQPMVQTGPTFIVIDSSPRADTARSPSPEAMELMERIGKLYSSSKEPKTAATKSTRSEPRTKVELKPAIVYPILAANKRKKGNHRSHRSSRIQHHSRPKSSSERSRRSRSSKSTRSNNSSKTSGSYSLRSNSKASIRSQGHRQHQSRISIESRRSHRKKK